MPQHSLNQLYAQHQSYLYRHGTYTTSAILKLLDRVDARITLNLMDLLEGLSEGEKKALLADSYSTARLVKIRESVRDFAAEVRRNTGTILGQEGRKLAGYSIEHTELLINSLIGEKIAVGVSMSQAHAAAMSRPMLGKHVRDWVKDLEVKVKSDVFGAIREGFLIGESTQEIVKRIRGSVAENKRDGLIFKRNNAITAVVRTSLTHIANIARESALIDMGVERLVWMATLDGRTSKICANLDGKVFKVGKGQRPPAHPNCRSIMQPFIENAEGERPYVADNRSVKNIPKKDRKGKIGRVDVNTNYPEWFKNQSAGFQREWLGKKRYDLYKKGNYPLSKFVDPKGREYTIDRLRELDKRTFIDLGL